MSLPTRARAALLSVLVVAFAGLAVAPGASAAARIKWKPCTDDGFQCAKVKLPRDYRHPKAGSVRIALTRLPASDRAHRIGSLFVNYGGPGGSAVKTTQRVGANLFAGLKDRFDIVGFDPRGVGRSSPSIDCKVNQETRGIYSEPFVTPENLHRTALLRKDRGYVRRCVRRNRGILRHASTANVARDLDRLRARVGDRKLTYFGFSYGTFLGATYASLFPHRTRALVLDGALDASGYINHPMPGLREQTAGFERELGRYFAACAANPQYCVWTGGREPETIFDDLVRQADALPLPAGNAEITGGDSRVVDGDDILNGTLSDLYAKQLWPEITAALNAAAAGDGSVYRAVSDSAYGRKPDGTYDPGGDRYFTLGAAEQSYAGGVRRYLDAGATSWRTADHFWFNAGYAELSYGQFPITDRGRFTGPFRVPKRAAAPLVVGTTFDPATVYRGAKSLVRELGHARLLTMRGDGHTAYGGNSPCIDAAVNAYLRDRKLPARGTTCQQEVAFPPPPVARSARRTRSLIVTRHGARAIGRYAAPLAGFESMGQ